MGICASHMTHVESILRRLPQWFGVESATLNYIKDAGEKPTCCALEEDMPVGFITLHLHSPSAAEIHVMGVHPGHQRRGIGQALLSRAEYWLRAQGIRFLQVKTLSEAHPSPEYALTRQFYQAMGFTLLEVFPTLWGWKQQKQL